MPELRKENIGHDHDAYNHEHHGFTQVRVWDGNNILAYFVGSYAKINANRFIRMMKEMW